MKGRINLQKRNLDVYEDESPVNESVIATAVAKLSSAVLYQDDNGNFYYLEADPEAFDIGTVALIDELTPAEKAEGSIKKEIETATRGL